MFVRRPDEIGLFMSSFCPQDSVEPCSAAHINRQRNILRVCAWALRVFLKESRWKLGGMQEELRIYAVLQSASLRNAHDTLLVATERGSCTYIEKAAFGTLSTPLNLRS